ncbi:MAG: class I SAM-dependent methyltransferase [Propionibacteriaceae bacterium]|nr:class I SAM-dependent methyltransferase [Propionibacteriaceae bacterium]
MIETTFSKSRFRWLQSPQASAALAWLAEQTDPASLASAARLRRQLDATQAAWVAELDQTRRRANAKLGPLAPAIMASRTGLEQATRWSVARWRADRLRHFGVATVIDAGCGIGIDALAMLQAGFDLVGIERDPDTADCAEANWRQFGGDPDKWQLLRADLTSVDWQGWLHDPTCAIMLDPGRRGANGRSWKVADLSPSWDFVTGIIERAAGPVVVKLGPGFPMELIPDTVDACWLSDRGDLVECSLWASTLASGHRQAVLLDRSGNEFDLDVTSLPPAPGPLGTVIYEPDPSVIRSGAIGTLARLIDAHPVSRGIAYLTSDHYLPTPLASAFAIKEQLDHRVKALRQWVHDQGIGILEIKLRGVDLDPAQLRRQLKPTGRNSATLLLTPTIDHLQALWVERLA